MKWVYQPGFGNGSGSSLLEGSQSKVQIGTSRVLGDTGATRGAWPLAPTSQLILFIGQPYNDPNAPRIHSHTGGFIHALEVSFKF